MNNEEKQKNYELAKKLLSEENFAAAAIVGAIVALLGAAALAFISPTWRAFYGFTAAGVGLIVGVSIGYFGRGISSKFGVLATLYTISSCILGKVLGVIMTLAHENAISPMEVLQG